MTSRRPTLGYRERVGASHRGDGPVSIGFPSVCCLCGGKVAHGGVLPLRYETFGGSGGVPVTRTVQHARTEDCKP